MTFGCWRRGWEGGRTGGAERERVKRMLRARRKDGEAAEGEGKRRGEGLFLICAKQQSIIPPIICIIDVLGNVRAYASMCEEVVPDLPE